MDGISYVFLGKELVPRDARRDPCRDSTSLSDPGPLGFQVQEPRDPNRVPADDGIHRGRPFPASMTSGRGIESLHGLAVVRAWLRDDLAEQAVRLLIWPCCEIEGIGVRIEKRTEHH